MGWLRTLGVVGAMAAQVTIAAAADMPRDLPQPEPESHPSNLIDLNFGWYLRGDLGYSGGRLSSAEATAPFVSPTENNLGGSVLGGVGIGVKSKWLRADVTVDYSFPMKYEGTISTPGDVTAKISGLGALFNGYLDLGTWYHVTPYIGAGAGAANMRVSDYVSALAPPFSDGSHQQWNFAWAVMGGLAYTVAPNILVDAGYRYMDFGDVKTASDAFGNMTFKNVAAHQVRLGMRWSFDDLLAER